MPTNQQAQTNEEPKKLFNMRDHYGWLCEIKVSHKPTTLEAKGVRFKSGGGTGRYTPNN